MQERDLPTLAAQLRSGETELGQYLEQLEAHFAAREPEVLAFVPEEGRFARLRREAQLLLHKFPEPGSRPPLFGVPLGVKDIFHVEGFVTRAGSTVPPEVIKGREAESVRRLKEAGALVMGKTVTTEFAYFAPGPTRNPLAPAHTPGGSSSGSAAAVGADLCPLGLGTQTIGSISRPAAFCGVVGFKPSHERISRDGVIPLSPGADHIGFFTTSAGGAVLVAALLVADWDVEQTVPERRPVLGIPEGPYLERVSPEGAAHFRSVRELLQQQGFRVISVEVMADFDDIYERHNALVAAEAAAVHQTWYSEYGDRYHPKTADLIRRGKAVSRDVLKAARAGRQRLRSSLAEAAERSRIDLWLAPAAIGAAPVGLGSTGDPVMNLPWTHAGLPTVALPAGQNAHELPLGVQLAGSWYGDEQLLTWAQMLEGFLAVGPAVEP